MHRFKSIPTFALITLLATTIPIPASLHEVTARTPHNPISQPRIMNKTVPTAHKFYLQINGFKDKTVLSFGRLECSLTLQIPLSEIDTEFYNWIRTTLPKSEGGQGKVTSSTVRTASLIAYNAKGKEVLRWNLSNAWTRSYKASKLDGASKDSAVASLEMAFDDIQQGEQREKVGSSCTEGSSQSKCF
jgi:hypothetical protein